MLSNNMVRDIGLQIYLAYLSLPVTKKINPANIFENNHQENYYVGNGKLGHHMLLQLTT